jgi:hypothetical protein
MRLLTILIILVTCGYAAMRGYQIVGFAAAWHQRTRGEAVDGLLRWRAVPGIAGTALKASLMQMPFEASPDATHTRSEVLVQLLAVRPLSSTEWLSLAGSRVASGAPSEQVISALTMSHLSGPNEGILMQQRGIFGLLLWETLPDAVRRRVIRDLAGAIRETGLADLTANRVKEILLDISPEDRAQITAMLDTEQVSRAILARIGL